MSKFVERLTMLRQEKHLSQPAVAAVMGVTKRTYQRYEAGTGEPQMTPLIRLADFYKVSLDYLTGRTDER